MKRKIYEKFAERINEQLEFGSVEVFDTPDVDEKFCDKISLRLDDNAIAMLYEQRDSKTAGVFFDTVLEYEGEKYYIEPYNSRLHNIAMI